MSKDNSGFFKVKSDWSRIKDKLLGCYLTPYFQKVLATGKTICYETYVYLILICIENE